MSEFLVADERAVDRLRSHVRFADGESSESDRTFYDTFDGRLRAAGEVAVFSAGRFSMGAASVPMAAPPDRLLAPELVPGVLRDALAASAGIRAVLPLVRVRTARREFRVLDQREKTVARLALERPALVASPHRTVPLRVRLLVEPVRGYDDELEQLCHLLGETLGLPAVGDSVTDEAVLAAGRTPGGTSSKVDVELSRDQRADAAAATVLRRLLEVMRANLDGAVADIDTEFLHDFRVAVRRSRAVQRELRQVFPPDELAHFRGEFRGLQQLTGDTRDLDVYVLEFESMRAMVPESMRDDLDPLLRVLKARRLLAHTVMVRGLRSERTARLLDDWDALLEALVDGPLDQRPLAAEPIAAVAGERIAKVYRRIVKMGEAISADSPSEAYHELRKKGKELRYLLELFGATLFAADVVKPMIKSLKALQDVLGRHQDREVQVAALRSLRDAVAAVPGGPGALMAMGALVERLDSDQHAARDEFAGRFKRFAAKEQRKQVKETFRA